MPKQVLVVDDNPHVRRSLRSLFESGGFKVCGEATDGASAIEQARQLKLDLILLDFAMRVMSGLQAAPLLRQMMPEVPIILLTLYADGRVKEGGCSGHKCGSVQERSCRHPGQQGSQAGAGLTEHRRTGM